MNIQHTWNTANWSQSCLVFTVTVRSARHKGQFYNVIILFRMIQSLLFLIKIELGQLGHRAASQLRQPGGRGGLPEDEIRPSTHRAAQQLLPIASAALRLCEGQAPPEQDQWDQQPGSPRWPGSIDSKPERVADKGEKKGRAGPSELKRRDRKISLGGHKEESEWRGQNVSTD